MRKFNTFFITYLLSPVNLMLFKGVTVHTVDFYYGFEFISCTKETKIPNFMLAINSYFTFHTLIHSTIRYYLVTFHQTQDFNISPCRDSISIPTLFFFFAENPILEGHIQKTVIKTTVYEAEDT